jgi:hypothetical protein
MRQRPCATGMRSFVLVLVLAACGGGSGDEPDAADVTADAPAGADAAAADAEAAIDAVSSDAGPPSPFLVGTWRAIPSQVDDEPPPIEDRPVLTLGDDGTWTLLEDGETETATWTADDADVTVVGIDDEGTPHTYVLGYVATADRLMLGALRPLGTVDGTVGTWDGVTTRDGVTIETTLVLRADNTAHLDQIRNDVVVVNRDGTWAHEVDDVVFTYVVGDGTFSIHFQELSGLCLGGPLFERI